ncbi:MAG: hypothetical protein WD830_02440 [Chloroflexota bacterium]
MTAVFARLLGTPRRAVGTVAATSAVLALLYAFVPAASQVAAILLTAATAVAVVLWKYPNETKTAAARILEHFAWVSGTVERESIRQDLEGTLSAGLESLASASPQATASSVRFKFVRSDEDVDRLPDGTLIVGITHHKDRTRNLVAAAWAYARRGVLIDARRHLDGNVSRGIDFTVTKSILCKADLRAVDRFIQELWMPAVRDESRLRDLTGKLETLEDDALFAPVLLEEFAELGIRLANRFPSDEIAAETASFVDHLYDLAQREPGQHEPTHFDGKWIRCAFVLVATSDVATAKGSDAYQRYVESCVTKAYPRIYIIARGSHVSIAESVGNAMRDDERVLDVRPFLCTIATGRGSQIRRLTTRIRVDVREYVGIGQRPIVAVGPGYEHARRKRFGPKVTIVAAVTSPTVVAAVQRPSPTASTAVATNQEARNRAK